MIIMFFRLISSIVILPILILWAVGVSYYTVMSVYFNEHYSLGVGPLLIIILLVYWATFICLMVSFGSVFHNKIIHKITVVFGSLNVFFQALTCWYVIRFSHNENYLLVLLLLVPVFSFGWVVYSQRQSNFLSKLT